MFKCDLSLCQSCANRTVVWNNSAIRVQFHYFWCFDSFRGFFEYRVVSICDIFVSFSYFIVKINNENVTLAPKSMQKVVFYNFKYCYERKEKFFLISCYYQK